MTTDACSFAVRQTGDDWVFAYDPPANPRCAALGAAVPVALLAVGGSCWAAAYASTFDWTVFSTFAVVLGCVACAIATSRLDGARRPRAFSITPAAIMVGEKVYDRAYITSLYIDSPGEGSRGTLHVEAAGYTGVTRHRPRPHADAANHRVADSARTSRPFAARRRARAQHPEWQIGLRYGGKDVTLAAGLSESTATVLFGRVASVYRNASA